MLFGIGKKFILPICGASLILSLSLFGVKNVEAESRLIEADGFYIIKDGQDEKPGEAKERAREDALRAACEKAGLYVESSSMTSGSELVADTVRTAAVHVLEVESSDVTIDVGENGELIFRCHLIARADYDKIVKFYQTDMLKSAEDYFFLANAQRFNRDYQAAVDSYSRAIELKPQNAKAYNYRGLCQRDLGNFAAALNDFRKATEIDPNYVEAKNNLKEAYTNKNSNKGKKT